MRILACVVFAALCGCATTSGEPFLFLGIRNTLALTSSPDLRTWTVKCVLLYHPDVKTHGFQYPDWRFDGEDIIAVVRTAYDDDKGGTRNHHDANYMTFHRFAKFRGLTTADSVGEAAVRDVPGVLTDTDGMPVASARIVVRQGACEWSADSGSEGSFSLRGMPLSAHGPAGIDVRAKGCRPLSWKSTVLPFGPMLRLAVVRDTEAAEASEGDGAELPRGDAAPPERSFSFRVCDAAGAPLTGASVQWSGEIADADGVIRRDVPAGDKEIAFCVECPGYDSFEGAYARPGDVPQVIMLKRRSTCVVYGTLVSPSGAIIGRNWDCAVRMLPPPPMVDPLPPPPSPIISLVYRLAIRFQDAPAHARYALFFLPDDRFVVELPSLGRARIAVESERGQTSAPVEIDCRGDTEVRDLRFVLAKRPTRALAVTVARPDGSPVEDAAVSLHASGIALDGRTATAGIAHFTNAPEGVCIVTVLEGEANRAEARLVDTRKERSVTLTLDESRGAADDRGESLARVAGEVRLDGKVLEQGVLAFTRREAEPVRTRIRDGVFALELPPGLYRVNLEARESTRLQIPLDNALWLVAREVRKLSFAVETGSATLWLKLRGDDVHDGEVEIRTREGDSVLRASLAGDALALSRMAAGRYCGQLSRSNRPLGVFEFEVRAGGQEERTVQCRECVRTALDVCVPNGARPVSLGADLWVSGFEVQEDEGETNDGTETHGTLYDIPDGIVGGEVFADRFVWFVPGREVACGKARVLQIQLVAAGRILIVGGHELWCHGREAVRVGDASGVRADFTEAPLEEVMQLVDEARFDELLPGRAAPVCMLSALVPPGNYEVTALGKTATERRIVEVTAGRVTICSLGTKRPSR